MNLSTFCQSIALRLETDERSPRKRAILIWFGLSLSVALAYGILGLQQAYGSEYVVQDDARQHIFWMQRFVDRELFPNDLIADYFQSLAPPGYTWLYRLGAAIAIEPLTLGKGLPLVLGIAVAVLSFSICCEVIPIPLTGFIATLLLEQNLWAAEDLPSATPRAFFYPFFLAFLYYLLRSNLMGCLGAIALQALFYPPTVLLSAGILVFYPLEWQKGKPRLSARRADYWFAAIAIGVSILCLLPYVLIESPFAPTVTLEQARTMPEFLPDGRTSFFTDGNFEKYWFHGRSGVFGRHAFVPLTLVFAIFLPFLLQRESRGAAARITPKITVLLQILLASFGLFFLAHLVLFTLYLPSRYTQHSLRVAMALSAAIAITLLLDKIWHWASMGQHWGRAIAAVLATGTIAIALIGYPLFLDTFPKANYKTGYAVELYRFFARQPKDILIASLSSEADNIPTFSQRSVLLSREVAIPYHLGYYRQIAERAIATIEAQYSSNPERVRQFIDTYDIDFWLLDRRAFTPDYLANNIWLQQYQPATDRAIDRLESGTLPVVAQLREVCSALATDYAIVLDSRCLLEESRDRARARWQPDSIPNPRELRIIAPKSDKS